MAGFYTCPRCWKLHRSGAPCYLVYSAQLQVGVDTAETQALTRFRASRPSSPPPRWPQGEHGPSWTC